jgi:hypothetical protein
MRLCCVVGAASAFAVTPAMGQAQQSTGTLSGSVTDVSGALVANASVILVLDRGSSPSTIATDAAGRFRALSLSPGLYKVSIDAPGFHPAEIKAEVAPGKDVTLAPVVLTAYARADVTVTTSQHDLAEAEVKAEEHQRLLGAIPNFYVTYDWQAAPLSTAQKYELGWRTIIDPVTLGLTAVQAGVQQATNEFPGYGSGPASYFKRLAGRSCRRCFTRIRATSISAGARSFIARCTPCLLQSSRGATMASGSRPTQASSATLEPEPSRISTIRPATVTELPLPSRMGC